MKIESQELQKIVDDENSWHDQKKFATTMKEKTAIENKLNSFAVLESECSDLIELFECSKDDVEFCKDLLKDFVGVHKKVKRKEVECLFTHETDYASCYLEVNAGSGGTESCDWAEMLLRMYLMWAKNSNFKTEIVHKLDGEEAGIKSVTVQIAGEKAYGWLKKEIGVHRLVRISPFDSNKRRHTSFASVYCYPIIDDNIEIDVKQSDIRMDTFRASGAGGQHVNKTESAVRFTHIPTGVVTQCQNGRSQYTNKETCMKMLNARLYELEMKKKEQEANKEYHEKASVSWGNQIRSYVLHPYQMIKDLRSGAETGNVNAFLNGEIDEFLLVNLIKVK